MGWHDHLDFWNTSYGQKKGRECHNPTLRECEDETHTPEMRTWDSQNEDLGLPKWGL
jgi:hypothetical protein